MMKRLLLVVILLCGVVRVWGGRLAGRIASSAGLGVWLIRIAWMTREIHAGTLPWQRILLPLLLVVQAALILAGLASRTGSAVLLGAAEVALLAFIWWTTRSIWDRSLETYGEDRLSAAFSLFLPPRASHFAAVESLILGTVGYAVLRRFRLPTTEGFGYLRNSVFPLIPLFLFVESPVEFLILYKVFGVTSVFCHLVLGLVSLWGILWTAGISLTMRLRPHRIRGQSIELNAGILARVHVPAHLIAGVRPATAADSAPRSARLSTPGTARVRIDLREPLQVQRAFGGLSRPSTLLLVSADHPEEFCRAIRAASLAAA